MEQQPVKKDDELEVEIESIGKSGDGLAKVEGFILFVKGTQIGDKPLVKVTKVLANYGFAEVLE